MGVSCGPGAIAITRIPWRPSSRASWIVRLTMPPFDAVYAAWPNCPSHAAVEAVFTITPRSPSSSRLVLRHDGRGETDHVEGADEVHVDHVPEGVQRVGLTVLADDECRRPDPCAVDDAVQPAEPHRCVDRVLDARLVADVGLDERADLLASSEVGDDHVCARLGEQACRRGTETRAAARDQERTALDDHEASPVELNRWRFSRSAGSTS